MKGGHYRRIRTRPRWLYPFPVRSGLLDIPQPGDPCPCCVEPVGWTLTIDGQTYHAGPGACTFPAGTVRILPSEDGDVRPVGDGVAEVTYRFEVGPSVLANAVPALQAGPENGAAAERFGQGAKGGEA